MGSSNNSFKKHPFCAWTFLPRQSNACSMIKITAFSMKVMSLVKQIPRGKVATYGQIAALAGKPHGARGVGWILNSCSKSHKLPWQRVINSQGKISFSTKSKIYREQKRLLLKEKIKFSANDSVSLKTYGWKKKPKTKKASPNRPQMFS